MIPSQLLGCYSCFVDIAVECLLLNARPPAIAGLHPEKAIERISGKLKGESVGKLTLMAPRNPTKPRTTEDSEYRDRTQANSNESFGRRFSRKKDRVLNESERVLRQSVRRLSRVTLKNAESELARRKAGEHAAVQYASLP